MPKSCINKKQYKEESIGGWIVSQLFKKKLKRKDLAAELLITIHGLNWKLRNNSFDYADLLTIFDFLGSSDEEVVYVMRLD
jgi:hypothetical protein